MLHITSDAYGRRPTEDDRRLSGPRDRRRDIHPKGSSDSYKEDRHRKHTNSPAGSRADNTIRACSTSRSPSDTGPGINKSVTSEQLAGLWKKCAEVVVEVAALRAERDPLDKVLRQRQVEYEKSTVKHTEFPSIPEVQNMHRVKYAERVRWLNAQIQRGQEETDKVAESIARAVFNLSSPHNRDAGIKAGVPTDSIQQQDSFKKHQAEISELKTKISEIEARRSQEQSDLKAEFARQKAEMGRQMEEMMTEMRKEVKAMERMKEEVKAEMEAQLGEVRLELGKLQKEHQSQQNELRSEFSKHERKATKKIEQQILALKINTDTISSAELSGLKSAISGLRSQVDKVAEQLAQNTKETTSLRTSQGTCDQKVEEHEKKLVKIDFDALEGVAEITSFTFPNLQRKVDKLQQSSEARDQAVFARVSEYTASFGSSIATMVDEVRRTVGGHGLRIKSLENAPKNGVRPDTTQGCAKRHDYEALASDVASTKAAVNRLTEDHNELAGKILQVDEKVAMNSQDTNRQLDMVRHLVTVLDSQFNSLSTKKLAEHIIGQLEQLYPNARQLASDVDGLKRLADGHQSRIDSLEEHFRDFKGRVDGYKDSFGSAVSHGLGPMFDEYRSKSVGQKRKRIDLDLNGGEHLVVTGTH